MYLGDRTWRINHLYWIVDHLGRLTRFVMNDAQAELHNGLHDKNLVLKSRQHGITSYVVKLFVDDWFFGLPGSDTIQIADSIKNSKKIFEKHVLHTLEHMPKTLLELRDIDRVSADTLRVNHAKPGHPALWSRYMVTDSSRGGNNRNVHISEYGKACDASPVKAREIKTGALNTLHDGSLCIIEATAGTSRTGDFFEKSQVAIEKNHRGLDLTRMDYKFFFFGWHQDSKNREPPPDNFEFADEADKYFEQLEATTGKQFLESQKYWYWSKKEEQGGDIYREHPSTPEECFKAIVEGAIYKQELEQVTAQGRECMANYDPSRPVYTACDIGTGKGHAMTCVFWQTDGLKSWYIDFYYNELGGIAEYAKYVLSRRYIYGTHFAPHDAAKHDASIQGGLLANIGLESPDRKAMALALGINWQIVKGGVYERIEAGRAHLANSYFDIDGTADIKAADGSSFTPGLLSCLRSFQYEKDEKGQTYKKTHFHNWASNGADAFTYSALAQRFVSGEFEDDGSDSYDEPLQSTI